MEMDRTASSGDGLLLEPRCCGKGDKHPVTSSDIAFRFICTPAASADWNMAVDAALADSVRAGGRPALRLFGWSPPALSLGRNQPAAGHFDDALLESHGLSIVRRPTGGRAVLHDREITYAALFPDRALGSPRDAYLKINEVLLDALRRLGVESHQVPATAGAAALSIEPCFVHPAPGELLAGGRKIVGSAQARVGGVLLQHGSLMLGRSPVLDRLPQSVASALEGTPAYLEESAASPPARDDVRKAIATAWVEGIGPLISDILDDREVARARHHARTFRDPAWTWRR